MGDPIPERGHLIDVRIGNRHHVGDRATEVDERTRHADAVFELREAVVASGSRERDAGGEVVLVGEVDERAAGVATEAALIWDDLTDDRSSVRRRAAFDLVAVGTEGDAFFGGHRRADGDDRDGADDRVEGCEIFDRPIERGAVVDAGAEDNLRVRFDAKRAEPPQLGAYIRRFAVAEEIATKFDFGRVHGDVERRQALLADARPVVLGEVCQGDEVAVEKAEAVVVVLHVERLAQALRIALEKAEEAAVVAGPDAVKGGILEIDAQVFIGMLLDLDAQGAVVAQHFELNDVFSGEELEVDGVSEAAAVDCSDVIAGAESRLLGEAAFANEVDDSAFIRTAEACRAARFGHAASVWRRATTSSMTASGVEAPAATPTLSQPANHVGSSSAADST